MLDFFGDIEAHYIPKLQLPSSQHSVWRCQTPGTNSTRGSCCSPGLLPLSENYTIEFWGLRACYSEICSTSWPGGLDLHFFHWNFLFFGGGSLLGIFGIPFPMQYIERLAQKAPAKEAEEVHWVFAFGFLVEVIFCQHVVTFWILSMFSSKKIFSQIFFFIFSTGSGSKEGRELEPKSQHRSLFPMWKRRSGHSPQQVVLPYSF